MILTTVLVAGQAEGSSEDKFKYHALINTTIKNGNEKKHRVHIIKFDPKNENAEFKSFVFGAAQNPLKGNNHRELFNAQYWIKTPTNTQEDLLVAIKRHLENRIKN